MKKKHYTLDEANAVLPRVKEHAAKIRKAESVWRDKQKAQSELLMAIANNGGNVSPQELSQLDKTVQRAGKQLERLVNALREEFQCELKGLDPILVDFYSMRDGREVYLCWKEDEEEITHWHDLDTGFTGRQPI